MMSFMAIHVSGMREQGVWGYIKNFAPKVPWPMLPFIYFMEIVGALVKPFSLAIRLFANILAGHILIAVLIGLIFMFKNYPAASASVVMIVLMSFLELFVAFLQAYIFTFLSTIFIGVMIVLMSFLELFVAFLQAYIFTFLSTIFIGFAVNPEH